LLGKYRPPRLFTGVPRPVVATRWHQVASPGPPFGRMTEPLLNCRLLGRRELAPFGRWAISLSEYRQQSPRATLEVVNSSWRYLS
jgi:hypothetical protein